MSIQNKSVIILKMFFNPQSILNQIHVDPGMTVCDFGCGSGNFTLVLAEKIGSSGTIFAFDVQKELLGRLKSEAVRKKINNINVAWVDLDEPNSTSLKPETVDRVFMICVLFQTEDKKALIREAKRILKKNGKIIVVDWAGSFGGLGPRKTDVISPEILRDLFEEEGFGIQKEIDAGKYHYGFVFNLN